MPKVSQPSNRKMIGFALHTDNEFAVIFRRDSRTAMNHRT